MKVTNASVDFPAALAQAQAGQPLSAADTKRLFDAIFTGRLSEDEIIAYLSATADRKPTVDELVGAVTSMRQHMHSITVPAQAIDLCGTGGDGLGTLNISTAVSFVVAACGVPVAKHGNRSASSRRRHASSPGDRSGRTGTPGRFWPARLARPPAPGRCSRPALPAHRRRRCARRRNGCRAWRRQCRTPPPQRRRRWRC